MSHIVTGIVQRRKVGSPTRKAVLMFMAGCASDDGSGVWVSKSHMAADLEMARRTVQKCVDDLSEAGLISEVGQRKRKNGYTTEYNLNLDAISKLKSTRELDSHVNVVHSTCERGSQQSVNVVHTNLKETINEPSEVKDTPASVLVHFADEGAVASFLAYRRKHKSKALTLTGAKRLAGKLAEINERGGDAADALGLAEERGWASVEPDWYFNTKGKTHGKPSGNPADDPTLRAIARAAGAF